MTPEQRTARLEELSRQARVAEARGDGWALNEIWATYRLVRDGGRDPDELVAEGVRLSRIATELSEGERTR